MKIQYKKIFFACLLALIFLLPLSISIKEIKINTVSAIEVRYPTILGFSITDSSSAIDYAKYFFNIGMAIAGTLAVIAIMFGGIYYLVSLNRGKFTDEGKQWIKSGVLGLILLVSAYLIAYTINPDLVYFRLERLLPLNFLGSSGDTPLSKSSITTYEEIPLGTLTENLLSRTMDCYDYDQNGDPIEVRITTDDNNTINGPTFLNHDRADCLLKLTEAAEKKAKIVRNLSDEIVRLMSQCSCAGKCDVSTTPSCRPPVGGKCPLVGYNGAACKPFPGKSNDCCPTDSGIKNPKGGKNFTVKEIIEHGPIKVDMCKQEVRVLETFDGSNEIGGGENNESCWAPLFETKATIKKPMDFIIGPGINTGAVSKSLNEWNKRFPSNKKIFGNYTASPPGVNYDNDNLGNGQNEIFLTSNVNFNVDGREVAAYANAIKNNLGEIVESDISLNPKFTWGDKKTSNVDHDFEGVMTHELGHSLGLGDLYGAYGTRDRTECSGTTMYGGVPEVEWRTLEKGDIKGLIDLYRLPSSTTILPSQTFTLASSVFETVAIPSSSYFLSSLLNLFSLSAVPQVSTQAAKTDEIQQCDYNGKTYKGLDEFRTQKTDISSTIEIKPKPTKDGKEIAIINNGDCPICDTNNASCQNSRKVCLKNSESKNGTWGNLKLIEQLTYLKEKIDQIKSSTEKDISQLDSARTKIAACYNIKSSVSLLGILEETKKEDKVVLSSSPFRDSVTNKVVDISKYCEGFDYANSNSYMKCQEICPETLKDRACYQGCQKCNEDNQQNQAKCLENQTKCVKKCYDKHACPVVANNNPSFATFDKCIDGFNQQCSDACDKKLCDTCPNNADEIKNCKAKCGNNSASKCLLDNEEKCTVNFPQLKSCADNYNDSDDLKNCMNNSYLCKYGSDEYAGYPDCVKNQGEYSSSFLYKNPDNQKCKNPYQSYTSGANIGQTCLDLYSETAKCPLASQCPKCPCGIIDETINYDSSESGGGVDNGGCPSGSCLGNDGVCSPGNCSNSPGPNSGATVSSTCWASESYLFGGTTSIIKKTMNFIISPDINATAFSQAIDEWNKIFSSSWKPFGTITVSSSAGAGEENFFNNRFTEGNGKNEIFTHNGDWTLTNPKAKNGEIFEGDMGYGMNPNYVYLRWPEASQSLNLYYRVLYTHELGHLLGLADIYKNAPAGLYRPDCDGAIMGEQIHSGPLISTHLTAGEINGIKHLYSLPNSEETDESGAEGAGENSENSQTILEYQVVTGTCNKFTYVGDPLTFYCKKTWEPESYLSGKWLYSSGADEIPVGQTVDDAKKWANKFIGHIDSFTQTTKEMIQYMKDIGQEQKYCQCDSTCEDGRPCSSSCEYVPATKNIPASCSPRPCDGISCQKVINLLKGGSTKNCPVEKDGIFSFYDNLYEGSKDFYKFVVVDARTDVLKELSYSRKSMNECSQQAVELGKDVVQTFSCTKAYRGISALQKRCYGIFDGQVKSPPEDRTDNWFCLKTLLK